MSEWGSACSENCGWCGACTSGPKMIPCAECGDLFPMPVLAYDDPPILRPVCDRCLYLMNEREERRRNEREGQA